MANDSMVLSVEREARSGGKGFPVTGEDIESSLLMTAVSKEA